LLAMAMLRVAPHGHAGGGHGSHGGFHIGHGHGHSGAHGHAAGAHSHDGGHHGTHVADGFKIPFWLIPSPVTLFSWLVGFGAVGLLLSPYTSRLNAMVGAVAGAVLFEALLVRPIWGLVFQ